MPYQATKYGKPLNILHVEDDDGDARAVERSFRRAKVVNPIQRAVDGLEALDILTGTHDHMRLPSPGLVLLDQQMPRMTGLDLVRALPEQATGGRCFVFLVESPSDQEKLAALDFSVAGYLAKDGIDTLVEQLHGQLGTLELSSPYDRRSGEGLSEPKLLCSHMTTITLGLLKIHALLEEIAQTRAVVSLQCQLRLRSEIAIDCGSFELRGQVTDCSEIEDGFLAGVELFPLTNWDVAKFRPDALFNPHSLVCALPGCRPDCTGQPCGLSEKDAARRRRSVC